MSQFRRRLPPLSSLLAFEAAARLRSITRAASELGVTQAAVSRQVHLMEKSVGSTLFIRLHRGVDLTEKGRTLSAALTSAFGDIVEAFDTVGEGPGSTELSIGASVSFSHFWLLPKISSFSKAHPDVKLRILTQDGVGSFAGNDLDLAIRYGRGRWDDGHAELLFNDEVFPVCSADYAEQIRNDCKSPADLVRYPLITSDPADATWTGWPEWLTAFSVDPPKRHLGMRCSFYTEAIYAALNGQGIALGWKHLVSDLLAQQRLVRLTVEGLETDSAYYVVHPPRKTTREPARLFVEWLKREAQEPLSS